MFPSARGPGEQQSREKVTEVVQTAWTRALYVALLQADEASPFLPVSDEEGTEVGEAGEDRGEGEEGEEKEEGEENPEGPEPTAVGAEIRQPSPHQR